MLAKVDYILSTKHSLTATYAWNRDLLDRPDLSYDFSKVPKVANDDATPFFSAAWRWSPTPTLTNEARGGVNIAPALFLSSEKYPDQSLSYGMEIARKLPAPISNLLHYWAASEPHRPD